MTRIEESTYKPKFFQSLHVPVPSLITCLFVIVAAIGMYNHEMWRDEFEVFLKMKDAPGLLAVFSVTKPPANLYLALLYGTIRLFPFPVTYQIFHLVMISLAVFLFNRYSPFSNLQKFFFSFGYFVLFEYGIISRDYSTLLLFLFLAIVLITREKRNIALIGISLFLLADHHVFGFIFSVCLVIYYFCHVVNRVRQITRQEKKRLIVACSALFAGYLFIISQYIMYVSKGTDRWKMLYGPAPFFMTLRSVWNALVPIPETTGLHFWNTNILPFPELFGKHVSSLSYLTAGNIVAVAASVMLLLAGVVIFSRKLPVLIIFLINIALQLAFLQYHSVFYLRYQGPLLLIFVYCYWLLAYSDADLPWQFTRKFFAFFQRPFILSLSRHGSRFITSVLIIQFANGIYCYSMDARYPFSASFDASRFIKKERLNNDILAGYVDVTVQPFAGLLNRKIYYPQSGTLGTYVDAENVNRRIDMSEKEAMLAALRLSRNYRSDVLLILNSRLYGLKLQPMRRLQSFGNIDLVYLNGFAESIVPNERYFLYLFHNPRSLKK